MLDKKALFDIKIEKPDKEIYQKAHKIWDGISKPIDGLGDFEELICKIAAIQRTEQPRAEKRVSVIFCADNGIVEEGISQSDKSITKAVAVALGKGISSACTLAKSSKVKVLPVDIGIDCDEKIEGVRDLKVSKGTANFLKTPAMTEEEALLAIERGIELVGELKGDGYDIVSAGEMGIGNTTTSAAVLAAILSIDSDDITGRGAGLDNEGLLRKMKVIREGIKKYGFRQHIQETGETVDKAVVPIDMKRRAFEALRCLGGLDIAALTGLFIGGAKYHIPVVIDGVISSTAAVLAQTLVSGCRDYMIASHRGREHGNELALKSLGLRSYIDGNMALGEGTGAIMLFPLIDVVLDYYLNGAKFGDYEIDEYERFS
ncbi:nicotinate-nucleotide--dimethylbenzimidazole phosphoribosyltransferase [Butyrivibrio sp. WCD3002]|uniref:nicotinate-nucleotide--dimethylbenzimidazole phosphoribosyltransferase n=1 Tax=Butyrivibrio sp. WCD3002 TaxID=1280676 RepID=UPI000422DA75|nr:nicotinate-nucleotide--dimethylbenzimidazole phosphoribosyltransferase [Butyrivibrio sp. WCD3002]